MLLNQQFAVHTIAVTMLVASLGLPIVGVGSCISATVGTDALTRTLRTIPKEQWTEEVVSYLAGARLFNAVQHALISGTILLCSLVLLVSAREPREDLAMRSEIELSRISRVTVKPTRFPPPGSVFERYFRFETRAILAIQRWAPNRLSEARWLLGMTFLCGICGLWSGHLLDFDDFAIAEELESALPSISEPRLWPGAISQSIRAHQSPTGAAQVVIGCIATISFFRICNRLHVHLFGIEFL